mmetsp:Transcript_45266/g.125604  ORF Transcript_45266/g.125604 Transcript_45266/m.125604 type:complete len:101 (-) Transcript_45266:38-340(-)
MPCLHLLATLKRRALATLQDVTRLDDQRAERMHVHWPLARMPLAIDTKHAPLRAAIRLAHTARVKPQSNTQAADGEVPYLELQGSGGFEAKFHVVTTNMC